MVQPFGVLRRLRDVSRDEEFQSFFSAESAPLERFATMLVRDPFEGAELAQEALARVYARWGRVRLGSPAAYARQTVVNLVRSAHRARKIRSVRRVPEWAAAGTKAEGVDSVHDSVRLGRALEQLPPIRRATLLLRFYEDMTEKEIAHVLDRPVGTVKSDIHRALRQLRPLLEETQTGDR
jgi:RNA polymerase sigma-70 factor (sigma-E family)